MLLSSTGSPCQMLCQRLVSQPEGNGDRVPPSSSARGAGLALPSSHRHSHKACGRNTGARQNKEGDRRNSDRFKNRHKTLNLAKGSDSSASFSAVSRSPWAGCARGQRAAGGRRWCSSAPASRLLLFSCCPRAPQQGTRRGQALESTSAALLQILKAC